jgi:hypothetical protein
LRGRSITRAWRLRGRSTTVASWMMREGRVKDLL